MTLTTATASFGPALKILYPNGLAEIMYEKVPLVGWMNKDTNFVGEAKAIVPFYAGTQGSALFANAQSNAGDIAIKRFLVTRVKDYATASVDAETILASANDKGAVAKALDSQIRGSMYELARSAGVQAYGDGSGLRGTGDGSWTVSGTTISLSDARDIVNFEVGMHLEFLDISASDAVLTPSSALFISAINRDPTSPTIEVNTAVNGVIASIANDDKIIRSGDGGAVTASGLSAWLPTTAPTSGDSFFGVDRSVDASRLGGLRFTGTSSLLEETIMDACAHAYINGAQPDSLFVNPLRFAQLNKSAYAKTLIEVKTDIPGVGYKAMSIPTASGVVSIIPDPNCPFARGYLLEKKTWELCSLRQFPHFAMDDGLKMTRQASADGVEFRIRAFWNIICDKPGHNMVITW